MKNVLFALFTFLSVQTVFGQGTMVKPYGFASIDVPTRSGKFSFDWARLGFTASPMSVNGLDSMYVQYEYDIISNATKYAYVDVTKKVGEATVNLLAGKFLDPIQWLWPGPAGYQLTRYPDAEALLKVYEIGIGIVAQQGDAIIRASYWNDADGRGVTGLVGYGAISVFGMHYVDIQKNAFGAVAHAPSYNRLVNVSVGAVRLLGPNNWTACIQNDAKLTSNLHFWLQADFTGNESDILAGLTLQYAYRSDLKLYADSRSQALEARVTFAFY